jgi:hypothetical protein
MVKGTFWNLFFLNGHILGLGFRLSYEIIKILGGFG